MIKADFDLFKKLFDKLEGEPEITIIFDDKTSKYMIIKYADYVTFQRCGISDGSGEIKFNNLSELYEAKTIDGICLKDDWGIINDIVINEGLSLRDDLDYIIEEFEL